MSKTAGISITLDSTKGTFRIGLQGRWRGAGFLTDVKLVFRKSNAATSICVTFHVSHTVSCMLSFGFGRLTARAVCSPFITE